MMMIADLRGSNLEMMQKFSGVTGVFCRNKIN